MLFQSLKCWLNIRLCQLASTLRASPCGLALWLWEPLLHYSLACQVKSISITAGQKACRRMAQCYIDRSSYGQSLLHSYWYPTKILRIWIIFEPLLSQLVLVSPINITHGLLPQPLPLNISPGAEYKRFISKLHLGQSIPPSPSLYVRCTEP